METTENTQNKNIHKSIKEEELPDKSKEDLIELVKELRRENLSKYLVQRLGTIANANKKKDTTRYKSKKNVDTVFENSIQKKFALKICYLGEKYYGYASQPHISDTIEEKIFDALKHTLLIKDRESSDYSRCGRTDKGVSALGNVIALKLRAKKPNQEQKNKDQQELDYVKMINGCLPADIKVLSCVEVPEDFSARYNCKTRVYKYFFLKGGLNIEIMREAAKLYEGEHDFRNFCKLNVTDTITFKRKIDSVTVEKIEHISQSVVKDDRLDVYTFTISGTAFLWHQIRCMVSVLFMIGNKNEDPSLITDLYELAPEKNLVLYDCTFEKVNFEVKYTDGFKLFHHFQDQMVDKLFDIVLYSNIISYLSQPVYPSGEQNPLKRFGEKYLEDSDLKETNHKKIKDRPAAKSFEDTVENLKGKKKEIYLKKLQNTEAYLESLEGE